MVLHGKRGVLARTVDALAKRWTVITHAKRWVHAVTAVHAKRLTVVPCVKRGVLARTVDAHVKRWTVIARAKRWVLAVIVARAKRLTVVPHVKRGVLTSTVDVNAKKWTVVACAKRCEQEIQGTLVTGRPREEMCLVPSQQLG